MPRRAARSSPRLRESRARAPHCRTSRDTLVLRLRAALGSQPALDIGRLRATGSGALRSRGGEPEARQEVARLDAERAATQRDRTRAEGRLREVERDVTRSSLTGAVPTEADLAAARTERDGRLAALRAASGTAKAPELFDGTARAIAFADDVTIGSGAKPIASRSSGPCPPIAPHRARSSPRSESRRGSSRGAKPQGSPRSRRASRQSVSCRCRRRRVERADEALVELDGERARLDVELGAAEEGRGEVAIRVDGTDGAPWAVRRGGAGGGSRAPRRDEQALGGSKQRNR